MDIITISILFATIVVSEEIFNGQLGVARKLLDWFEQSDRNSEAKTYHED